MILLFLTVSARASDMEKLHVRVGAYDNPPKIYIEKGGKVSGFWPELLGYIAEKENWEIEYVKGKWGEGLKNLENNQVDIMPDVALTKSRAKLYAFSNATVIASWSRVYVRSDNHDIATIEDLKGKRIAGLSGSANMDGPDGIKKIVQSFNLRCQVVEMESYQDVFQALEDGFADAVITNRNFGDEYIHNHPVKSTAILLSPVPITFAFPKDGHLTNYLSGRIDAVMSELIDNNDSIYYRLIAKYFETGITEKKIKVLPAWFKTFMISASISGIFLIIIILISRRQVRCKTRELRELNHGLQEKIEVETSRRLLNEQIIFEQKKFADMGHMIGAISHQWRQPLNNIYLISQWLQEEWENGGVFGGDHLESFRKMSELIQHMSETIDDFRNFFQPEKDKSRFNVTSTMVNCLRLVSPDLLHNKISLHFTCRCEEKVCEMKEGITFPACEKPGLFTNGYEGELKQIILNIISNSRDALIERNVHHKAITVETFTHGDKILITVSDNGGGIPEEVLPKVFDPYFTTKEEGKGLGIGLYMSRTLLTTHMDSDISIENTESGTKTTITIPRIMN